MDWRKISMPHGAKVVTKVKTKEDKKLKTLAKKFNANPIPDVAEINFFTSDSKVMQFKNPELLASMPNQVMIVFGEPVEYDIKDKMAELMSQFGPKELELLKNMKLDAGKNTEEAPELV